MMVILYPAHPFSSVFVRATWSVFCLLACLVFTPPHWSVRVFVSLQTPLCVQTSLLPFRRNSYDAQASPPHPPSGLSLSHFVPLGALSTPHTSCSVLVGGIEESILFRSVPCMLLLARWFLTRRSPLPLPRDSLGVLS